MSENTERTPFRWVFWTEEPALKACPLCGEKTIDKIETYRTSAPAGSNTYVCRIYFKCGHVLGARAIDLERFKTDPGFFSLLDITPPGYPK